MKRNKLHLFLLFLILASAIKLVLGAPYHHEDADQFFYWGKYLEENGFNQFYQIDVPNATRANYPPIINYVLFLTRKFHLILHDFTWYFHLRIPYYFFRRNTSLFIPWLETKLGGVTINKLPAVIADAVNCLLIYQIVMLISKNKQQNQALFLGGIFLLSPAVWYSSSVWGQMDSLYLLPILVSLIFLIKERYLASMFFLVLSVLTKPTAIYAAPVFILVYLKKTNWWTWLKAVILSAVTIVLLYYPFAPGQNLNWINQFFISSLSGPLGQMVNNAFNFWVLPLGFNDFSHTDRIGGLLLYQWGYGIYFLGAAILAYLFWQKKEVWVPRRIVLVGFLFSLLAFLVLPKVHERYFYPALIFSLLLAQFGKNWLLIYLVLSMIHFFNLYHFWWIPRFEPLVILLSNIIVVKLMILAEIGIFAYGLTKLSKEKA